MQKLTLEQAIAYNKTLLKSNRQHTLQIKSWYSKGYTLCQDLRWYYYCDIQNKFYLKYTTRP